MPNYSDRRSSLSVALLAVAGAAMAGTAGCSSTSSNDTTKEASIAGAPTAAQMRSGARPSASEIQARIQQVQADTKMPDEAKALLIGEMQHALSKPAAGPAPVAVPPKK